MGNKITSDVTIEFTEYENAVDMAFSEIPMKYKSNGEDCVFSSSGMFDIQGASNGNKIEIAEGKQLKIDYHLAKQNEEIDFFKLNENNEWDKVQDIESIAEIQQNQEVEIVVGDTLNIGFHGVIDLVREGKFGWFVEGDEVAGDWAMKGNGERKGATLLAEGADVGHTYPDIVKGLNVNGFGVYNCDQICRVPNRVNITAKYTDEEGQPIKGVKLLSMIDTKYNGAFSFNPKNFTCNAKGENVLLLFTRSGKLYVMDADTFLEKEISGNGSYSFAMREVTDEIKNSSDLAAYLGIEI
ncbi:MAG: hypothetical protein JKY42_07905 [Flavobacteriales bacterium]|nr:hypothetical protein [Flavobacteriales bacterium]